MDLFDLDLDGLPIDSTVGLIKEQLAMPEVMVGSSALLRDRTVFLAELSSHKALPALHLRMDSEILIAPNLL